jgi:uncharacterized protein YaaQ
MIVKIENVMSLPEFSAMNENQMKSRLDALEILIRKYTNNNFQNRHIRFFASSLGNRIMGCHPFIRVGDTVQISESNVNDGLYVVTEIGDNFIRVDKELFSVGHNLVTKIEYPVDVQQGVIKLLQWDVESMNRIGIKSETISRHSVTYFDQDKNNQVMGFPVSLLGFLEVYKKARF